MNRDCTLYEIHLAAYAGGDLPEPEYGAVSSHLSWCDACRAELVREYELRDLLGELPVVACPDRVSERLFATLGLDRDVPNPAPRPRRAPVFGRPPVGPLANGLMAAGLMAAVLLAALFLPGRLGRPDGPGPQASANVPATVYSDAEIAQARHDLIASLTMAAEVLDRSREQTMNDVFGNRLPGAVSGSLRPHAPDAQVPNRAPGASPSGGNG